MAVRQSNASVARIASDCLGSVAAAGGRPGPRRASQALCFNCYLKAVADRLSKTAELIVMHRRKTVVCPRLLRLLLWRVPLAPSTEQRKVKAQADGSRLYRAHGLRVRLELRPVAFAFAVEERFAMAAFVAR